MGGNISGFGAQDPSAQQFGVQGDVQISAAQAVSSHSAYSKSTIEQSQIDTWALMLAAGYPLLTPPQTVATHVSHLTDQQNVSAVSATTAAMVQLARHNEQVKNDIINTMWDIFLKNVQELSARAKKDYIKHIELEAEQGKTVLAADYLAYLLSLSAGERTKEVDGLSGSALVVQFTNAVHQWIVAPVEHHQSLHASQVSRDYPSSGFIAGAMLINADTIRFAIGDNNNNLGYQMSVSPVADALTSIGPTSGLPGDYQAAAALVAALLNGGAVYKATFDSIQEAAQKGSTPGDIDFAINYANTIMRIVKHGVDQDRSTNKHQNEQSKLIRLMLTAMALNLLYRASYGGMTGEELASLLNGNTDVHEMIKPMIKDLVALLNSLLPSKEMDEEGRNAMIAILGQYIDSKDSVSEMLSATRMFKSYLASDNLQHQRWASAQG